LWHRGDVTFGQALSGSHYEAEAVETDTVVWRWMPCFPSTSEGGWATIPKNRSRRWQDVVAATVLTQSKSLRLLYEQNRLYWRTKIDDSKGDSRKLWRTLSGTMGDTKNTSNSSGHTADEFATFFANKVDAVRQSTSSTALPDVAVTARHALNEWELVTPEVVVKLIGNAPNKSCQLDAAPTWLVK